MAAAAGEIGAERVALAVEFVARGADGVVDDAALTGITGANERGGELRFERGDELLLIGAGFADFAPDLGEFLRERGIVETPDLPSEDRGEVGARDHNFFDGALHLIEEDASKRRARHEDGEGGGTLVRREAFVAGDDAVGRGRIVERGESLNRGDTERGVADQGFADLAKVGRLCLDQGAQGGTATLGIGLVVEGDGLHFGQCPAAAKEDFEIAE